MRTQRRAHCSPRTQNEDCLPIDRHIWEEVKSNRLLWLLLLEMKTTGKISITGNGCSFAFANKKSEINSKLEFIFKIDRNNRLEQWTCVLDLAHIRVLRIANQSDTYWNDTSFALTNGDWRWTVLHIFINQIASTPTPFSFWALCCLLYGADIPFDLLMLSPQNLLLVFACGWSRSNWLIAAGNNSLLCELVEREFAAKETARCLMSMHYADEQ